MKLCCALMAAGASARFGAENKLLAPFKGEPLYRRAFAAAQEGSFHSIAVVSHYEEILSEAKEAHFIPVYNPRPEDGVSLTVSLALRALPDADAVMFLVADQPLLTGKSVADLADFFLQDPSRIAAVSCRGRRGNPVVFPKAYFGELLSLTGDRGGSAVIRAHEDALRLFPLEDERELFDVDTAAALASLEQTNNRETES